MNYREWEERVPQEIKEDSLWKMEAYRLALFASEIGWQDVEMLDGKRHTRDVADQLVRSLGSIGANIAEGYSRGTSKDRARFYEYALGSARESRHWYQDAQRFLSESVLQHRLRLLNQIIRLLLVSIPDQRGRAIREAGEDYEPSDSV